MKTLLPVTLPHSAKITVKKGDIIKAGEKLARNAVETVKEKIPLSKILSVNPKKISQYLVIKLGSAVKRGQVLAKKSGVFKNIQILSPLNGTIDSIDLKEGTCLLTSHIGKESFEYSPVNGVIEEISHNRITISFDGIVIEAQKGTGDSVAGDVLVIDKDADMLDFSADVFDKIIICRSVSDSALAKLEALNVKALVTTHFYQDFISNVQLNNENYLNLLKKLKKHLIVIGRNNKVIVPS